ncbi:MAG: hypothetical protein GXX79_01305 [Actinomycetales bacterium]|nr:hypothetical protein [Actinomycetales bacterium]
MFPGVRAKNNLLLVGALAAASLTLTADQGDPSEADVPDIALPQGMHASVYEWRDLAELDAQQSVIRLREMKRRGYDEIFIDVSRYMDLIEMPEPRRRTELTHYRDQLSRYIGRVRAVGFSVQLLAGFPSLAHPDVSYLAPSILSLAGELNAGATAPGPVVTGVQFDVEPYQLPEYGRSPETVVRWYLEFVRTVIEARGDRATGDHATLEVGFAVPVWFASSSPPLSWDGDDRHPLGHLMAYLGSHESTYLSVMAYRNELSGDDGILAKVDEFLGEVDPASGRVKLTVAQEVGNVEPSKITHYGLGNARLSKNLVGIYEAFGGRRDFRGVAVNDFDGLESLDDQPDCVKTSPGGDLSRQVC